MKGIIFTEFIEMVEEKFGFEMADKLLTQPGLKSDGIYTSVGTYDIEEMLIMLGKLSDESKISIPDLLQTFGFHLFDKLKDLYPHFTSGAKNSFEFLSNIEEYIHVEVLKLYHDAELPSIKHEIDEEKGEMLMIYKSQRKLSDLAIGLIKGCIAFYKEDIEVKVVEFLNEGKNVKFLLSKK